MFDEPRKIRIKKQSAAVQEQEYENPTTVGLFFIVSIAPSVLFLVVSGGRGGGAALFYFILMSVPGFFAALAVMLLTNKLKLYRTLEGIAVFLVAGAALGAVVMYAVYILLAATTMFIFHLPLSAFINGLLAAMLFSTAALAAGLLTGCILLPKEPDDEEEQG